MVGLCAASSLTASVAAQAPTSPTIHRVTVQPDTGVLTITGAGLGPDLVVSVDGQPVTVLPGASDTGLEVMAPATVLSTPGTYQLTVVDLVRQVGAGFIVASPVGRLELGSHGVDMPGGRQGRRAKGADERISPQPEPASREFFGGGRARI